MGISNKTWLATLALIAISVTLLAACDSTPTPPAPNQQQYTPTPLPPPRSTEEVIARAKQVFATETAQSYAITETNVFTMSLSPNRSGGGQETGRGEQVTYKAWYQAPNLWRTETTTVHNSFSNNRFDHPSVVSKPITTIDDSDGVDFWRYYVGVKQALAYSGEGIRLITEPNGINDGYNYEEGATETTRDFLAHASECYTPTLQGSDTVAGRAAYIITLAPRCLSNPSSYYTAPRTVWLDQQDYLLLKDVLYFDTRSEWGKSIWVREVRNLATAFNTPIDATVFTFKPPADANVIDNRPLPGGLVEARQRASFPIFIPMDVPVGLIPEPPDFNSKSGEPIFEAQYFGPDGIPYIMISEYALGNLPFKQLHPTDEPITLLNGIIAYYRSGADWCNEINSFIYWVQDGTIITISTPSSDGIYGKSALSKDELIKVAASMSKTADLGKIGWPPYPTFVPDPGTVYTAPTPCPTPHQ